jgi:tol-pal system protein YbgF
MRRLILTVGLVAVSAPSWAASKEQENLQILLGALRGQMTDLQRAAEDSRKEVQRLNEVIAEQNAFLKRTAQEQKVQDEALQAQIKELGERIAEMQARVQSPFPAPTAPSGPGASSEVPGSPAPGAPASAVSGGAPPPAPKELYSQAYADYARGNFDLSIQGFQEYIRNYPSTDLTDNAQYWIGECHYSKQKYNEAIEAWKTLFRDYPSSDKLPDGHVKMGMALEKLGRKSQALLEYRFVIDRYPNSQASRIARDRLNPQ